MKRIIQLKWIVTILFLLSFTRTTSAQSFTAVDLQQSLVTNGNDWGMQALGVYINDSTLYWISGDSLPTINYHFTSSYIEITTDDTATSQTPYSITTYSGTGNVSLLLPLDSGNIEWKVDYIDDDLFAFNVSYLENGIISKYRYMLVALKEDE